MFKELAYVAGGVGIGYALARYQLDKKYQENFSKVERETRDHYDEKYAKAEAELFGRLSGVASTVKKYQGIPPEDIPVVEAQNVEEGDSWDRERKRRETEIQEKRAVSKGTPPNKVDGSGELLRTVPEPVNYNRISTPDAVPAEPVTTEEKEAVYAPTEIDMNAYAMNETDFEQKSFTYFAEDDVLADDDDQMMDEVFRETMVGSEALAKLMAAPEALGGADVLFLRNDRDKVEFEILWREGSYAEEARPQASTN